MTVHVSSAAFRRAVTIASKVVEKRSSIPILSTVRCHANGRLDVLGTDLDIAISAQVDRTPGPAFDVVLGSPRAIVAAVSAGGGDTVTLSKAKGQAQITSGSLAVDAMTYPSDDFPSDLARPVAAQFTVTLSAQHIDALSRVAGAMSSEETRYYLNGVVMESTGDGNIRLAATDGHRLYFVDVIAPDVAGTLPEKGIIIPRKAVGLLIDLAKSAEDGIRIEVGPQAAANREDTTAPDAKGLPRIAFSLSERGADVRCCAKLIDGTFPDYRRVVPKEAERSALFKVADLRRAVTAISGHSRDYRATKLALTEAGAHLSAAYVSIGLSAAITVPCEHRHAGYEIGFNGGYLASVLSACRGDEVVFAFGGSSDPVVIRDPADTAWTAVLMPMRLP